MLRFRTTYQKYAAVFIVITKCNNLTVKTHKHSADFLFESEIFRNLRARNRVRPVSP